VSEFEVAFAEKFKVRHAIAISSGTAAIHTALAALKVGPGDDVFGREVVLPDGSLDRRRLGALVFKDPSARRRLNTITHPEIRRRIAEQVERTAAERPDAVILVDIPLLLDTAGPDAFDLDAVIVVQATPEQQIARLMARDGLTREEAESRLAAQRPIAEKVPEADWVIDNTGSIEQTRAQVEALWGTLRAPNI